MNEGPEKADKSCTCIIPKENKQKPALKASLQVSIAAKSLECDLENEPTPNLECMYEGDDEYHEMYMEDLESGDFFRDEQIESEKVICVCEPEELPAELIETDRCGSKIEIPWLSIALPPPGTYTIKSTKPPKVRNIMTYNADKGIYSLFILTEMWLLVIGATG